MRIPFSVVAWLPLAVHAADADTPPEETVVVTANRAPQDVLTSPASVSRIGGADLAQIGAQHQADVLNRIPGVYIQPGSGAESLTAIRSPVLTGAGSCGAFLVTEDSLPIRPVGFCNVNEMFEVNYEQAGAIEVLRGPGSAMFGASAVHGIVNVLTPRVADLPAFQAGFAGGSDSFRRVELGFGHESGDWGFGAYGFGTDAPGWRDASGVGEGKLNLLADGALGGGTLRLRASGTLLNQETAGFIQGYDSYKDEAVARSNPNPEAFRDASSARVSADFACDQCFDRDCRFDVAALYRRSRMDFIQHFLIGKPYEHNAQTSYLVSGTLALKFLDGKLEGRTSFDAETADSELTEYQPGPATDGTPAQNRIRPAGLHYDYTVASHTVGITLAADWHFATRWALAAALRVDQTVYDYDNQMISGNTDQNGVPCPGAGCLYSRPADRQDRFDNVAPKLTLSWQPGDRALLYLSGSTGYRPPEMTEMYRLQRQQSIADLDSEQLDSIEAGWKFRDARLSVNVAAFAMDKSNVIMRDANGFNLSSGSTTHRGIEYDVHYQLSPMFLLHAAGTFARHEYGFSAHVDGGETIIEGNDVDTAPHQVHAFGLDGRFGAAWIAALDVEHVGEYFLDAANTVTYPGHTLANVRLQWLAGARWRATLRVDNVFDTAYADRADFAFGNYRYFPGRGRAWFLALDYSTD